MKGTVSTLTGVRYRRQENVYPLAEEKSSLTRRNSTLHLFDVKRHIRTSSGRCMTWLSNRFSTDATAYVLSRLSDNKRSAAEEFDDAHAPLRPRVQMQPWQMYPQWANSATTRGRAMRRRTRPKHRLRKAQDVLHDFSRSLLPQVFLHTRTFFCARGSQGCADVWQRDALAVVT